MSRAGTLATNRHGTYDTEYRCFRGAWLQLHAGVYRASPRGTVIRMVGAFETDTCHLLLVLCHGLFREISDDLHCSRSII
ncbi:MAG: hypothetical protein ABFC78_11080, partial [Methanoregula sp.]